MRRRFQSTLVALLVPLMAAWGVPVSAQGAVPASASAPAATPATAAPAATDAPEAADAGFSKEQLEQLVAPIALYADALLMQVLMAATYPLEIVSADRWLSKNAGLKDEALDEALKEQDWDPSVKSLCTLPDVLKRMSENLDWTQDLGDAFLGQQDALLDTVQVMRGKAYDSGNLKTTEQQVITVEKEKIIVIQSPAPEIVYVPTYSPTVVYGGWYYPSYYYPPMYPYYPPGAGLVAFGVGVAVGAAIWGGCHWGWGHSSVNVNVNRYNSFNRNTNVNVNRNTNINANRNGQANWNHDPSHRGGVNYQNQNVAGKYGAQSGTNRVSSQQARGWSGAQGSGAASGAKGQATARTQGAGAGGQAARTQGAGAGSQGAARTQGAGAGSQATARTQGAGAGAGAKSGTRPQGSASGTRPGGSASSYSGSKGSAYSGSKSPSMDRAASSRGSMSRGTASYGGGGARGGGGRRR